MDISQTQDQFADMAQVYEDSSGWPFRQYLEAPSVFAAVGPTEGKTVFDLGCGAGDYTRWLKGVRGASTVVGYDASEGMLEHARQREEREREPLGIEYLSQVPSELDGRFDVVLAVYVLPYATTAQELRELCGLAARVLRPGGKFVTLPAHPDFPWDQPDYYASYGLRISTDREPRDADPLTLRIEGVDEAIVARYWSREAIERALADTGFEDISWPAHFVTPEGVSAMGEQYWQAYLSQPHAAIISCRKALGTT